MEEPSFAPPASHINLAGTITATDAEAIRAVVERQIDAWNRHDMDAFVAETTSDVEWVNVVGMHWRGREAVRRAHIAFHKGMFSKSTLSLSAPPEMRQIAPGVVQVVKSEKIEGVGMTPAGTPYPSDGAIMTVLFLNTPDGWRITHAHNTNINAMAVAHDPARQSVK